MKPGRSKSEKTLIILSVSMIGLLGFILFFLVKEGELVKRLYFSDRRALVLNGLILILFVSGLVKLITALVHYAFEEREVTLFITARMEGDKHLFRKLSPKSIIFNRYFAVKDLYDKNVPINHGAISSVMLARESVHQSFPKFVNNVLILTGVFGTIVSLIFALVGASAVLKDAVPGEGLGIMLSGMNTALTTTATAIVCFFFFSFFFQKLTDVQTVLFGQIEEAVITHIVPEFSFDVESVNLKTESLVKELRELVLAMKEDSESVRLSVEGFGQMNLSIMEKLDMIIEGAALEREQRETVVSNLGAIRTVLKDGFRLDN